MSGANDYGLGPRVEEHRSSSLTTTLVFAGFGILTVVGSLIALSVLEGTNGGWLCGVSILGAAIVVFAAVGLPRALRNRKVAYRVHEHGMVFVDGQRESPIRWADLAVVPRYIMKSGVRYVRWFVLHGRDGAQVTIDKHEVNDANRLIERIRDGVEAHAVPAYVAILRQGGTVPLGVLQLDPSGIVYGNGALRWNEIRAIDVDLLHGVVLVMHAARKEPWAQLDAAQIPNAFVLPALVRAAGSERN